MKPITIISDEKGMGAPKPYIPQTEEEYNESRMDEAAYLSPSPVQHLPVFDTGGKKVPAGEYKAEKLWKLPNNFGWSNEMAFKAILCYRTLEPEPKEEDMKKQGKAIKKPIPVDFMQLTEKNIFQVTEFIDGEKPDIKSMYASDKWDDYKDLCIKRGYISLKTLESGEGTQNANFGDFILKGIDGECWPVKADIFERTYNILS